MGEALPAVPVTQNTSRKYEPVIRVCRGRFSLLFLFILGLIFNRVFFFLSFSTLFFIFVVRLAFISVMGFLYFFHSLLFLLVFVICLLFPYLGDDHVITVMIISVIVLIMIVLSSLLPLVLSVSHCRYY